MTQSEQYRRMLNKMGYYDYQNGLIFRHLNQKGGWNSHLQHSRNFILKSINFFKPEKVTVLGSGWLLELPVAEMIEITGEICLIDIIHPPDVIKQAGLFKNVRLIEQDVSGGLIEEVWQKTRKFSFIRKLKSLENILVPEYKPDSDPGLVISLNILTQLEYLPVSFLDKRSCIEEEEFIHFRQEIQKKHIDFLKKHRSVLISDYEEVITAKGGSVNTVSTLLATLPEGQMREEWTWDFDQTGADYHNKRSIMKVIAIVI
jgi:hypothetical protein